MTDYCLICECEPTNSVGWFTEVDGSEAICPWCVKDIDKIKKLIRTHNGSDYHARQIFDEIEEIFDKTDGVGSS